MKQRKKVIIAMLLVFCMGLFLPTASMAATTSTATRSVKYIKKNSKKSRILRTVRKRRMIKKWTVITITTSITKKYKKGSKKVVIYKKITTSSKKIKKKKPKSPIILLKSSDNFNDISEIKKAIPTSLYTSFCSLGFKIIYTPSMSPAGRFSIKEQSIYIKKKRKSYVYHEMGHFLSALKKDADTTKDFSAIYQSEKSKYSGINKSYVISTSSEYFAESFCDYIENKAALKKNRPRTYQCINTLINSVTDKDTADMRNRYSIFWHK